MEQSTVYFKVRFTRSSIERVEATLLKSIGRTRTPKRLPTKEGGGWIMHPANNLGESRTRSLYDTVSVFTGIVESR